MIIRCAVQSYILPEDDDPDTIEMLKNLKLLPNQERVAFWRETSFDIKDAIRISVYYNKANATDKQKESDGCAIIEWEGSDYITNIPFERLEGFFPFKSLPEVIFEWDHEESEGYIYKANFAELTENLNMMENEEQPEAKKDK